MAMPLNSGAKWWMPFRLLHQRWLDDANPSASTGVAA
jgi:hypothetical protein